MKPLDEIDRNILRQLQDNARLSNADLAERVGSVAQSLLAAGQAPGG